jgi:hypothetical protein
MSLKGSIDINEPKEVADGRQHALSYVIPWLLSV